jgi:D-alanyl-D-alanine carboxypeptidase
VIGLVLFNNSSQSEDEILIPSDNQNQNLNDIPSPNATATLIPTPTGEIILSCENCDFAPVDKNFQLPKGYVSEELEFINISGGGKLNPEANKNLIAMNTDMEQKGLNMSIISSYRSYATQEDTFQYWVSQELAKGYSKDEARQRANVYSAMPGHSEHQLGTTVDVKCNTCDAFVDSPANRKIYDYIEQNAHKYGYVVSYPEGKENLTGYTYEPWHIRYIGEDLATELYELEYLDPNNDVYLSNFLLQKQLY